MKKISRLICIAICIVITGVMLVGCSGEKNLSYSGSALAAGQVGVAYSQSIGAATGEGDPAITYSLKENTLPAGLSLNNGKVEGTPTQAVTNAKFTVIAKADGFTDAEAEFTVSIEAGALKYEGINLGTIYAGEELDSPLSVASATGADNISYALKVPDSLPAGLSLSLHGEITGTPTTVTSGAVPFAVVARAENYADAEAVFTITVSEMGVINYTGKGLPDALLGIEYSQSVATANAFGLGAADFNYELAPDSAQLPAGLDLINGIITGTPSEVSASVTIKIIASAAGLTAVSAEFTIKVLEGVMQTTTYEAFLTNLDEYYGGGIGYGGGFDGVSVIERTGTGANAYNSFGTTGHIGSYFMQGMHRYFPPGSDKGDGSPATEMTNTIEWKIQSDRKTTATLSMSLGMELLGTYNMHSGIGGGDIVIKVNGKAIEYSGITLSRATDKDPIHFQMFELNDIELKAGVNTISYVKGENVWINGTDNGGPALDAIQLESVANLSWAPGFPMWDNISWKFPLDPIPV